MARINEMAGRSQGQTLQDEDYFHIVAYQPALSRSTGEAFDEEGRAGQTIRFLRGARPLRLVGDGEQQDTDGDIGDCQKSHLDTHDEYSCFAINAADMAKFLIGEIRKKGPAGEDRRGFSCIDCLIGSSGFP
ncbi:hypothetical protein HFN88_09735 [Rhizobium laguerreae]|uniref:hypothetical protein n=1 Tax=Rhizobium laguerreae TaxID=1076926 RepID=UPI001C9196EB|nr:hypothetical protein [Rhizobium laguerreae]MBY3392952.1 hypothetical protein [Rhizobium laguerreae]